MARGKKYDLQTKEKALALIVTGTSLAEISNKLGIPEPTLCTWKKEAEKDEEFKELRTKKKKQFVDKAWKSIELAIKLGEKRVKRALEKETELDMLLDEIQTDEEMSERTKLALITKIRALQVQGLRDISTFIGTLYDKQALAAGEANNKTEVNGKQEIKITGGISDRLKKARERVQNGKADTD